MLALFHKTVLYLIWLGLFIIPHWMQAHNGLVSLLDSAGIELTESQGFVNDLTQPLANLMEKDVRIILASFNATWARRVFCAVSRINLYGGRYQWILAGPRQERWWMSQGEDQQDPTVNCETFYFLFCDHFCQLVSLRFQVPPTRSWLHLKAPSLSTSYLWLAPNKSPFPDW